jgi:hypothetical protein
VRFAAVQCSPNLQSLCPLGQYQSATTRATMPHAIDGVHMRTQQSWWDNHFGLGMTAFVLASISVYAAIILTLV